MRNPKELARQLDEVLAEQAPPPRRKIPKPARIPPPLKVVPIRNWRPIDTAPTNGTAVLITDGFVIEVGRNCGDGEGWCSQDGLESWDGELTYWMPLPDLPIMQSS